MIIPRYCLFLYVFLCLSPNFSCCFIPYFPQVYPLKGNIRENFLDNYADRRVHDCTCDMMTFLSNTSEPRYPSRIPGFSVVCEAGLEGGSPTPKRLGERSKNGFSDGHTPTSRRPGPQKPHSQQCHFPALFQTPLLPSGQRRDISRQPVSTMCSSSCLCPIEQLNFVFCFAFRTGFAAEGHTGHISGRANVLIDCPAEFNMSAAGALCHPVTMAIILRANNRVFCINHHSFLLIVYFNTFQIHGRNHRTFPLRRWVCGYFP